MERAKLFRPNVLSGVMTPHDEEVFSHQRTQMSEDAIPVTGEVLE